MKLHTLHAALIHAPLTLLPAATVVDVLAIGQQNRALDGVGRVLWAAAAGSAALAGVSGLSASQQVRARSHHASDMMLVHGATNALVTAAVVGLAAWRGRRGARWGSATAGVLASLAALYGGYLGGELVYGHGVGVSAMPADADAGVDDELPLLSARAPGRLARDAVRGTAWVATEAAQVVAGHGNLDPEALKGH